MWAFLQLVNFRGDDEVILAQTLDGVCRQLDDDFAPRHLKIWMVPLAFGNVGDFVGKGHRLCKILEFEFLGNPARIAREAPVVELFEQYFCFGAIKRTRATFAGDAFLLCEFCHDGIIARYYYLYMKALWRALELVLDAILPLRARAARTQSRTAVDFSLSPSVHELLGAKIVTLMEYREPSVQDLIRSLKYDRSVHAASIAAKLLEEYLAEEIASHKAFSQKTVLIIPVPLHRSREKERGFNQIAMVLNALPADFKTGTTATLMPHALMRTKATKQQTRLHRSERLSNVAGAFALPDPALLKNAHVFLIDDVTTTGATLVNAATPLRRAGANVSLIALARA